MTENQNIQKIVDLLKKELPLELQPKINDFLIFVNSEKMRASYAVLIELIDRCDLWRPSTELRALIKSYESIF